MINKYSYDTNVYPFRELFCALISKYNLEYLHESGEFEDVGNVAGNDNNL